MTLVLCPEAGGLALVAGFSVLVLAARGFGDRPGKGYKSAGKAVSGGGRIKPCSACAGSGKKPCQFCEGSKFMKGFLGDRVSCVPCQATGTLGITCKTCTGLGFFP
jgi:hypothetical protein